MPRIKNYRWQSFLTWTKDEASKAAGGLIAVDTETSGVSFHDEPFCATVTWRDAQDGRLRNGYIPLEGELLDAGVDALNQILLANPSWIFHNAKFDLGMLERFGVIDHELICARLSGDYLHDTEGVWHLLDENATKSLESLAKRHLGASTDESKVLRSVRRKLGVKKDEGYAVLPRRWVAPYAMKDTEFTYRLFELGWPQLQERGEALENLYGEEMETVVVLLEIEAHGVGIDVPYLEKYTDETDRRLMQLWSQLVEFAGNEEFNPRSNPQVMEVLKSRGIKVPNVQAATLKDAAPEDEFVMALLEYKALHKLNATYQRNILKDTKDGVCHPWFRVFGPRTGRMASGEAE